MQNGGARLPQGVILPCIDRALALIRSGTAQRQSCRNFTLPSVPSFPMIRKFKVKDFPGDDEYSYEETW